MSGKTEPENTEKWSKSALKNKKRREAAKVNENSKKSIRPKYSWNLFFLIFEYSIVFPIKTSKIGNNITKKKFREIV